MSETPLRRALQARHLTMIAIGGTIGAGLFVGSGPVIASAGPAAVLSYVAGGVIVILAMRMIGEMAVLQPTPGGIADWPRRALGNWAGFTTGWLYWYSWIIVIAFEAVAAGEIVARWIEVPSGVVATVFLVGILLANLTHVRAFGEMEYWFVLVKVLAVVAFLVLALAALTGLLPGAPAAVDVAGQELAPGGWLAVLTGLLVVLFSYAGTEVVAIAAAESEDPANTLRRATRSVVGRILLFYIGSVVAIVLLLPTADTPTTTSPFSAVLDRLGVPSATTIMDVVIVVALCSAMNSALYVCSRMLYGLAQAGDATPRLMRVNGRGVPQAGLLISAAASAVALAVAVASPDVAFLVLLGAASAVLIPLYLLLAFAELRIRREAERTAPERLSIRMWFFPYGTYLLIAVMVAIAVAMIALPDFLPQVVLTGLAFLVILAAYALRHRRAGQRKQHGAPIPRQVP